MKIAVVTPGRFHSFDQAAQLEARGALGRIFSGYPRFKLRNEAVPQDKITCVWLLQTLAMASQRLPMGGALDGFRSNVFEWARDRVDRFAAGHLEDCDGVIALSGTGLACGSAMQRRGGLWVCDRGSTHILFQDRILKEEARIVGLKERPIHRHAVAKELAEYAAADAIFVPSAFVRQSFLDEGVAAEKLKLVPYGVNIAAFSPQEAKAERFTVLFAGQVTYRKGIHYLLKAWRDWAAPHAELRIAGAANETFGALADWAGGKPDNVTMLGHLDRRSLISEMSRAHALVLPSIEEGLALVMAQAMACRTPVIASRNTGAETLFTNGVEGFIGPARDTEFLVGALDRLAGDSILAASMATAAFDKARRFGDSSEYGERVMTALAEVAANRKH